MMEGFSEIMFRKDEVKHFKTGEFFLYKMAGEGKIPAVKIEFEKDDKVRIYVPYEQKLIKKEKRCSEKK